MGRGNQGRNIQTLPAGQYEGSMKVSETRDSSLQVLATNGNQFPNLQTNLMNVNAGFFDDVSSFILSPFQNLNFYKIRNFILLLEHHSVFYSLYYEKKIFKLDIN